MIDSFEFRLIDYCCKKCDGDRITKKEKIALANELKKLDIDKIGAVVIKHYICSSFGLDMFYEEKQMAIKLGISYKKYKVK